MGADRSVDFTPGDLKGLPVASVLFVKKDVKPVAEEGGIWECKKRKKNAML